MLNGFGRWRDVEHRAGTGGIVHRSDEKGVVWTKMQVTTQSTFVFMKPDGSTTRDSGPLDAATLTKHVNDLLAG